MTGKLAEMVVRNTAPTSFNVDTNYSSLPSGALAWWHFNDGTGTWADDAAAEDVDIQVVSAQWSNMNTELKPSAYEHRYSYDKVGNRTAKHELFVGSGQKWTYTYNGLNQLTQQNKYSTDGLTLDRKWLYTYDANGNLSAKEKQTSASVKEEKWVYKWNPRDQMQRAIKYTTTANNVGSVTYEYCLTCDGVISTRFEYAGGTGEQPGALTSGKRYEYDGLNLLRVDELYDDDVPTNGLQKDSDGWRTIEVSTHKPGSLGALIGKRVYTYNAGNYTATPNSTNDYTYTYDAVGNVVAVYNANSVQRGYEKYYFSQDAFGNELSTSPFNGTLWSAARTVGITEHQTGKWIDPFTGLYYFHARWYFCETGQFLSRDLSVSPGISDYLLCYASPVNFYDPDGMKPRIGRTAKECDNPLHFIVTWINKGIDWGCWCSDCYNKFDKVTVEAFHGGCKQRSVWPFTWRSCEGDAYMDSFDGRRIDGWTSISGNTIWLHTRLCDGSDLNDMAQTLIHELLHSCHLIMGEDIWRGYIGYDKAELDIFTCTRDANDGKLPHNVHAEIPK